MEKTINLTAPTSWKELDERQLKYAAWLLSQDFTEEEIWTYAFYRFTKIKMKKRNGEETVFTFKKQPFFLSNQEVLSFAKKFSFLTSGIEEVTPLSKMAGFKACDARLRGVPFAQYLACENYYQAFLFKKTDDFLNKLCACFYFSGKNYNSAKADSNAREFEKLPFCERYTAFLWFSGLKKVLKKHFPNYFVGIEADEESAPTMPNMRKQIEQMLRALSGGDVTKVNAIYGVETWTALAELDAKALEYKVMKAKMKQ